MMKQINCELLVIGGKTVIRREDTKSEMVWRRRERNFVGVDDFLRATEIGSSDPEKRLGCDYYRRLVLTPSGVDSSWWERWPQVRSFFGYVEEKPVVVVPHSDLEHAVKWTEPLFKPTRKSPQLPSAPLMSSGPHKKKLEDDKGDVEHEVVRRTGVMVFGHKTGASIQINKDPRLTAYMLSGRNVIDHQGVTKLEGAVVNVVGNVNAKGESDDPEFVNKRRK